MFDYASNIVQIMRNRITLQLVSVDIYKISMFMYKTIIYGLKIKILRTANNKENEQTRKIYVEESNEIISILQFHYDLVCKVKQIQH